MSIMVKGMEMPKNCKDCRFWMLFLGRYLCFAQDVEVSDYTFEFMSQNRLPDCPLVEVPSDVRLIDADKLKDTIVRCINDAEKEYPKEDFELVKMVYESCLYHIAKAPSILEEKEE